MAEMDFNGEGREGALNKQAEGDFNLQCLMPVRITVGSPHRVRIKRRPSFLSASRFEKGGTKHAFSNIPFDFIPSE